MKYCRSANKHISTDDVKKEAAVRTLYNGAETRVKVNGQLGAPFPNKSGVKQGCPLSGVLYILVQEVQLHMIRSDPTIRGIPIPGPDGALPPRAMRLPKVEHALTERGLVDDTMIALASRDSIPPLLRILDRFEEMSNHRMNISKTMMLLLGNKRDFDLSADAPPSTWFRPPCELANAPPSPLSSQPPPHSATGSWRPEGVGARQAQAPAAKIAASPRQLWAAGGPKPAPEAPGRAASRLRQRRFRGACPLTSDSRGCTGWYTNRCWVAPAGISTGVPVASPAYSLK